MGLEEHELREWVQRVAHGEASRRQFIRTMLGLGLSVPLLADLLATAAPAAAQDTPGAPPAFTPTRRGGGGKLRLLAWNAPTLLNPHLAAGGSSAEASRVVYEPLGVVAVSHQLRGLQPGPWDSHFWNLAYWYRGT